MDKLKALWDKLSTEVALALVAGLLVGLFVHPIVGIVAGGGLYLYQTGKLAGVMTYVKGLFTKA